MNKILFACLGNICRSPIAEGIFRDIVEKNGNSNNFEIDSCGTAAYHVGELPDARMRKTASKHGITLNHKGRQIKNSDLDYYDLILVMDRSNYQDVIHLCQSHEQKRKVKFLREYDLKSSNNEVPDPYYGGTNGFEEVYQIVVIACQNLFIELVKNKK